LTEEKIGNKKTSLLSWAVFLPTLIIVLFALILGTFPGLMIIFFDNMRFPVEINVFEPTIWAFPILISSAVVFTILILYQKNHLPDILSRAFKFILNFELSRRTSFLIVAIFIAIYAIFNVGDLYVEEPWEDYGGVKQYLQNFSFDDLTFGFKMIPYSLGYISMEIFGSYRVAPYIASMLCLFFTYLVTVQISKKRFAGIIALVIVLQSGNFLIYDTTITYPILWIMFYLLSLYFIFKIFFLSPMSFIPTILSHPLSLGLLPITIPFIALLDLHKRKKVLLLLSYFALIVIGLVLIYMQIIPIP